MTHTLQSLEALEDRELDALAGDVVFNDDPPRMMGWATDAPVPTPVLWFSSTYEGFGLVVERMQALGFKPDMKPMAGDLIEFGWNRFPTVDGRNRWCCSHSSIPRAAAIAAILAVQGRG